MSYLSHQPLQTRVGVYFMGAVFALKHDLLRVAGVQATFLGVRKLRKP